MMPLELKLPRDRRSLAVTWENGAQARLPAQLLRSASRAASQVRADIDGPSIAFAQEMTITDVSLIGAYAVQLSFSDGHDRGIFPWSYLLELSAVPEKEARHG